MNGVKNVLTLSVIVTLIAVSVFVCVCLTENLRIENDFLMLICELPGQPVFETVVCF